MATTKKRTLVDVLLLINVFVVGFFAVQNAVAIGDWWHFLRYNPPRDIKTLADESGMNNKGQDLFYRFSPQFVDAQTIKTECLEHALGCSVDQNIYILKANNSQERNRSVVTAAHEMLHIAFSRLNENERNTLKILVDKELAGNKHPDIQRQLEPFTDDTYYNEAHSYIGSSAQSIGAEFEDYFNRYFADRSKTIKAYNNSPER